MKFKRILHLSIDDLRFDGLSISPNKSYLTKYGLDSIQDTPNLDYFAKGGILFTAAYTSAPFTPPSHASMLTGTYQNKHGIRPFLSTTLSQQVKTLFEILNLQNFYTIAAIDFKDIFELNKILRGSKKIITRNDDEVIKLLIEKKDENTYLFMHIGDIHPPYGESFYPSDENYNEVFYKDYEELAKYLNIDFEPFRTSNNKILRENLIALSNKVRIHCEENMISDIVQFPRYLNGINKFDKGRFNKLIRNLKANNLIDLNTLIVITSDHGQAIIPQNKMALSKTHKSIMKFDHGETVIEEIIRVPLIFYSPSISPKEHFANDLVSIVDITPTILDFLNISQGNNIDGISLKSTILKNERQETRAIYAEAWFHDRRELSNYLKRASELGHMPQDKYNTFLFQQAVLKDNLKLVRTNQTEDSYEIRDKLFNITQDPFESFDLLRAIKLPKYLKPWETIKYSYEELKNELSKYSITRDAETDPHNVYKTKEEIKLIEERLAALGYIEQ